MNDDLLWKYGGLALLTLQQACMPLLVKYTRNREENELFIPTVNVFFMEVIKIVVCSAILVHNARSVKKFAVQIYEAMTDWVETGKVCLPALIYTLQNNLYYIALSNLEPTTFCAFYQLKILTTALMFRFVMNRALSPTQWMALVLLVVGVTDVQMQYQPPPTGRVVENSTIGFICVIAMCLTSAFAGVYLEKVLKGSETNVFVQNVRIASVGLLVSGVSMLYQDSDTIREDGIFRGFDTAVWIMTTLNSVGGLLIAVVMRYADNILKIYAQSAAIIGAAIGSWILFDFVPNLLWSAGVLIVIISMYLYSKYPYRRPVEKTPILEGGKGFRPV
uniref:UDP-galactose transporter n=1 Tax=Steinernema glaseri TaxID=37863 RepID=A0A1I8AJH9_9BILA